MAKLEGSVSNGFGQEQEQEHVPKVLSTPKAPTSKPHAPFSCWERYKRVLYLQ